MPPTARKPPMINTRRARCRAKYRHRLTTPATARPAASPPSARATPSSPRSSASSRARGSRWAPATSPRRTTSGRRSASSSPSRRPVTELQEYADGIESLARRLGLDYYPVDFELAPASLMTEIAVYGLPVRMPHWSFGVRYIHQLVRQSMGHSKIFEVMFPGDPCRAFLMDGNSLAENTLVTAHVLGHADFSKNNSLFARFHAMAGGNIVEHAAAHAHRIQQAIDKVGLERVELVLDAALALESHVDVGGELHRQPYPEFVSEKQKDKPTQFQQRFANLPGTPEQVNLPLGPIRTQIPPHPEYDLLWFIANYAPELEQWERDIFLMVRAESLYFYPVFACQIMNEGWASYWHARLLREADFLPQPLYLSALKAHSDVVRPYAADRQAA